MEHLEKITAKTKFPKIPIRKNSIVPRMISPLQEDSESEKQIKNELDYFTNETLNVSALFLVLFIIGISITLFLAIIIYQMG